MASRTPAPKVGPLPSREEALVHAQASGQVDVPPEVLTQEEFDEWRSVVQELAAARARESSLRDKVFKHYFPNAKEGTNKVTLPDGRLLDCKLPYSRDVNDAFVQALEKATVAEMKAFLEANNVECNFAPDAKIVEAFRLSLDSLIERKPSLVVKAYRTLTAEQAVIFDACLTTKPGSPQIKLEEAKDASND